MRIEAKQLLEYVQSSAPGATDPIRVVYRAVTCSHPGKPAIVFLCESPDNSGPTIFLIAEKLRARMRQDPGLADDTIFYGVHRNFSADVAPLVTEEAMVVPVWFGAGGQRTWGPATALVDLAIEHGIPLVPLKQSCLDFPGR